MGELQLSSLILDVTEASVHEGRRPLGLGLCQGLWEGPLRPGWALQLFRPSGRGQLKSPFWLRLPSELQR